MKIKMKTIPTRITTYFQRGVCSRRKTHTYNYHKRKWNKKVTSNGCYFYWWTRSTGPFSLFWFNSYHHDGTVFRCFPDSLLYWRFTGNNHLTSATRCRKFKRFMRGMNERIILSFWHFWLISRVVREKKNTLHKKSLLRSIYSRLPVTRTLYISNLPLTQSNFHFPSNRFLYNFTLDNSNSQQLELFSVSLEGSNYRESTVPFEQFIS